MNRRKFLLLFGGSVAALGLPGTFQLPEVIPEVLPALPTAASTKIRYLASLQAFGTSEVSRPGRIAVARIATKNCIFMQQFNTYGGAFHMSFPPGLEIVEIPGHEISIAADEPDITWYATWRNEDGSMDITAGIGGEWRSTTHQPKIEWEPESVDERYLDSLEQVESTDLS